MLYHSTRNSSEFVPLKEAVMRGLAPDGGLYVPEHIPQIQDREALKDLSYPDFAFEMARLWYGSDIPESELQRMVQVAYADFSPALKQLDTRLSVLELFHGPTLSFKDFGARMLAQVMNHFAKQENRQLTILAATSGDTGVAVASAFAGLENIRVVILYPSGKVSPFQESQMLSLKGNVQIFSVRGTFDDCQANVKQAFADASLISAHLTSANSINIGRLIPQSWYYAWATKERMNLKTKEQHEDVSRSSSVHSSISFSVPSGNFGNLTACLMAKMMGAPIGKIIAATNINDIVPHYLATGAFQTRPSVLTLANSMDIGNPSNWERIRYWLGDEVTDVREELIGSKKTDDQIRSTIHMVWKKYQYALDPHGAVGFQALWDHLDAHPDAHGIAVMTGSPYKYRPLLEELTDHQFTDWPELIGDQEKPKSIDSSYEALKSELLVLTPSPPSL
jgi:threonine synthase